MVEIKTIPLIVALYIAASAAFLVWGFRSFVAPAGLESNLSELNFPSLEQGARNGEILVTEGMLEIHLASSGVPALKDPAVEITSEGIEVTTLDEQGFEELTARVTPTITNDKLKLELVEVKYKGFKAPRFLTGALEQVVNSFAHGVNLRLTLSEIELLTGEMVLTGQSKLSSKASK